jgi:hypothetical protein
MAYLRQLIHACDLYRPTTTRSASGQDKAVLPGTATTAAMPCFLQPGYTARVAKLFGADLQCDGVVYFAFGADVRPKVASTDGLNDRLVITAAGVTTPWLVVGVREVAQARAGYVAAAVKRSAT